MAGNGTIGALKVVLGIDTAQFEAGLKKSQAGLSSFAKGAGVLGAVVGTAMVAAATAVGVLVKAQINAADELSKTAQKVGTTVEELSRLKYAAELSDVSLDGLSTGLKKLSANMAAVQGGEGGKAATAFRALGISVTDASGRLKSSTEIMGEVADDFSTMEDGAGKTALAMAIFGKSGTDLIPMLNGGKAGLAEMTAEADALGLTLSTKTAAQAEAFNDNLTRLQRVGTGLTTQLAAALLPALESFSNVLVSTAKNASLMETAGKLLDVCLRGLVTAGIITGAVFGELYHIIGSTAAAVIKASQGDFAGAQQALAAGGRGMVDTLTGSLKLVEKAWSNTGTVALTSANRVRDGAAPAMVKAAEITKAALSDEAKAKQEAKEAADAYIASLREEIETFGLTSDQRAIKEGQAEAAKALAAGLLTEAAAILRLVDARMKLMGLTKKDVDGSADLISSPKDLAEAAAGFDTLEDRLNRMVEAAQDVGFAVDQIFYSLKNGDWMSAAQGAIGAFKGIRAAIAEGGPMGGAAAAASALGPLVGGKLGGALSGAGAGASLGTAIMPGIGTAIGAGVGALVGFLGGGKAKKKAKREAAEKARLEAEQKAADLAAAKRTLEIRLMELSGDTAGALAAQRERELAAMDPTLHEQQKAIWLQEDLAAATAKANALAETRKGLETELLRAQGQDGPALALERAAALSALDESLRPLQQAIWDTSDAATAAAAALQVANDRRGLEAELLELAGDKAGALAIQRQLELAAMDESLRPLQSAIWGVVDAQDALAVAEEARATALEDAQARTDDARDALERAAEAETSALEKVADRFNAIRNALGKFGDDVAALLRTLTAGSSAQSYDAAKAAFLDTVARAKGGDEVAAGQVEAAGKAFLDISQKRAGSRDDAMRDANLVLGGVRAVEAVFGGKADATSQQLEALKAQVDAILKVETATKTVEVAIKELAAAQAAQAQIDAATGLQLQNAQDAAQKTLDAAFAKISLNDNVIAQAATVAAMVSDRALGISEAALAQAQSVASSLSNLDAKMTAVVLNTSKTARTLDDWDGDGMPDLRDVA